MSVTLVAGMSGILLDLYTKAGTVLFNPNPYPTFQVFNASSLLQGSGTGYNLSIGHWDARNITIPSSGGTGTWSIVWSAAGNTKTESFTVDLPTLTEVGDIQNTIAKIKQYVRFDIGDFTESLFSDIQLERYIDKAVARLNRELGISYQVRPTGVTPGGIGQPAVTPPISVSFLDGTLFPDNDEIRDIVILQTEVLLTRAEMSALRRASAASAAAEGAALLVAVSGITLDNGAGLSVRNADGVQIDTTSRLTSWLSNKTRLFLDDVKAREDQLKDAINRLRYSISSASSKVIY